MQPPPAGLPEGCFVRSTDNDLGIGKLARLFGQTAMVRYFHSIHDQEAVEVSFGSLERVCPLPHQARCYVEVQRGVWLLGRVGRPNNAPGMQGYYEIRLPRGEVRSIPETNPGFWLRCDTPLDDTRLDDPTDVLALRGLDRAEYHQRRQPFAVSLLRQREACRGMTGLLSGRINLFPHQIEVVRRVLEDPVQRYLLADEVGLGKTIEAGAILRQFLLDVPRGQALVLVPPLLEDQWEEELELRFAIRDLGADRVHVRSTAQFSGPPDGEYPFVLIDEAQHIAALAIAPDDASRARYDAFARLCHRAQRLLLLSATPARHNEREFLAMLHLLDETIYSIQALDAFTHRVTQREVVGQLLLRLEGGARRFVLDTVLQDLGQLRNLFRADHELGGLADELARLLLADPLDQPACDRVAAAIRVHVSETYRLHRRLLRSRRGDVSLPGWVGRAPASSETPPCTPRRVLHDKDPLSVAALDGLADWREEANSHLRRLAEGNPSLLQARKRQLVEVFRLLVQGAGSWPGVLFYLARARLHSQPEPRLSSDVSATEWEALCSPLFEGEAGLLRRLLDDLRQPRSRASRVSLLARLLRSLRDERRSACQPPPRCAVFTGTTAACHAVVRALAHILTRQAVEGYHLGLTRPQVRQALERFRTGSDGCFVLVCDQAAEEGRNLQFAEHLFHFDLPLSPNRLEQRIGRLDRIGRAQPVQSWVFVGPRSASPRTRTLFEAWYLLLAQGFRVFDTSIAGLQFFVNDQLPGLLQTLFEEGARGLLDRRRVLLADLHQEQQALSAQDAIDAFDVRGQDAAGLLACLQQTDAQHGQQQTALEGWVVGALRFRRSNPTSHPGTTRYEPRFEPQPGHRDFFEYFTRVPLSWVMRRLGRDSSPLPANARFHRREAQALLDRYRRGCPPGIFERAAALGRGGVRLYRLGDPFVDALADYILWDDRGRVFAFWRECPSWMEPPLVAFRFDYQVSADITAARELFTQDDLRGASLQSLQRRADALFPPLPEMVCLDQHHNLIDASETLEILKPAYGDAVGTHDHDLSPRDARSILDRLIPPEDWPDVCREACARSQRALRQRWQQRWQQQAERARGVLDARIQQLQLRLAREGDQATGVTRRDVEVECRLRDLLISGIEEPRRRLDSVGLIVLAGRPSA
jgi:ATP-dependent helicase HepA